MADGSPLSPENIFKKLLLKYHLPMKFLSYAEESGTPVFSFSAPEKVDFRDFVRELNHTLNKKVELRQVGARDQAKFIKGVGPCGRSLCCALWLPQIPNVPTKIVEELKLSGAPSQYTGACGKLLCCLMYEDGKLKFDPELCQRYRQEKQEEKGQAPKEMVETRPTGETTKKEEENKLPPHKKGPKMIRKIIPKKRR